MGRDLGKVVSMGCRAMLVAVAVTAVLVGPVVPAASADDVGSPTPAPAGQATPTVSPPSQQQIDDARNAMERLRQRGSRGTATPSTPATLSQVAGPLGASSTRSVTSRISDEAWWTIGAGAMVLLVASEATRVSARRAKHRKKA